MAGIVIAIWIGLTSSWATATNWSPTDTPPGDPFASGIVGLEFGAVANRIVHYDLDPATPFARRELAMTFKADGYLLDGSPYPYCRITSTFGSGTSEIALDHPGTAEAFCTPLEFIANGAGTLLISGALPDMEIKKTGVGIVKLTHASAFSAATTIDDGLLIVNANRSASNVTLTGGRIGGTGRVGNITSTGGGIAPGESPGILSSGSVSLDAASEFVVELNGTTVGTNYDQLNVTGTVSLGGATLSASLGFSPSTVANTTFVVINNDGADAVAGTFAGHPEGSTFALGGRNVRISYVGGTGNDVTLTSLPLAGAVISISPATLPAFTVGSAASVTFSASGGTAPYTFAVTSGALPAGLSLSAGGVLSGTPTTAGAFSFAVTATDSTAATGSTSYSGTVAASVPSMPFPLLLIAALAMLSVAARAFRPSF